MAINFSHVNSLVNMGVRDFVFPLIDNLKTFISTALSLKLIEIRCSYVLSSSWRNSGP